MEKEKIKIPFDIYESPEEIVIIMPMWGVSKEDIQIWLEKTTLYISWVRKPPKLKETLQPVQTECFRGEFSQQIPLPQNIFFDKISSHMTENNILVITVPKIIIPEKLEIKLT